MLHIYLYIAYIESTSVFYHILIHFLLFFNINLYLKYIKYKTDFVSFEMVSNLYGTIYSVLKLKSN